MIPRRNEFRRIHVDQVDLYLVRGWALARDKNGRALVETVLRDQCFSSEKLQQKRRRQMSQEANSEEENHKEELLTYDPYESVAQALKGYDAATDFFGLAADHAAKYPQHFPPTYEASKVAALLAIATSMRGIDEKLAVTMNMVGNIQASIEEKLDEIASCVMRSKQPDA